MKKILILGLVLALMMMFSFGVMAQKPTGTGDDPDGTVDDGWQTGVGTFENWSRVPKVEVYNSGTSNTVGTGVTVDGIQVMPEVGVPAYDPTDNSSFNQQINLSVTTHAYIPCFLDMELFGNVGWAKAKSIGQGSNVTRHIQNGSYWMAFHPGDGGYLNEDWTFKTADQIGTYSQISPYGETYINACDMWTANLYANVNYGFSVEQTTLFDDNYSNFFVQMRYLIQEDMTAFSGTKNLNSEVKVEQELVNNLFPALTAKQINMQFRVPYGQVPAGNYSGTITFRMYTI